MYLRPFVSLYFPRKTKYTMLYTFKCNYMCVFVCLCMCVCVYICMPVCIYVYIFACIILHVHRHTTVLKTLYIVSSMNKHVIALFFFFCCFLVGGGFYAFSTSYFQEANSISPGLKFCVLLSLLILSG